MRTVLQIAVAGVLAIALSSCMTPPTQYNPTGTGAATLGSTYSSSSQSSSTYVPPPATTTPPPPLKDASVDKGRSAALTQYLKSHRLPLVGAQVLVSPSGQQQLMLYGFVATQYGKNDAEAKARRYLGAPDIGVNNQIKIEPQLAKSSSGSSSSSYGSSMPGVQAYENQQAQDAYQQSQIQQYQAQAQGPSALMPLLMLLGSFGGSFGGGGFGGGFGGYGGGYPPPGAFGYPAYPPAPGPGYGPPYSPFP